MKRNLEGAKPKTSICVYAITLDRLKSHMKYGDTVNGMIDSLLDFYESNKGATTEDGIHQIRRID